MARTDSQQDAYLASQEYADLIAARAEELKRERGFYQGTGRSAANNLGEGAAAPRAYTEEGYREAGGYRGTGRSGLVGPGAPAYGSSESKGLPPSNPDAPKLTDDPNDDPNNPGPTLPIEPGYIPPKVVIPGIPIVPVKPKVEDIKPKVEDIKPKEIDSNTRDAFAMLKLLFESYGLGDLADEISGYMTQGFTSGEALIKLKTNPGGAYATRFAGNFARQKSGFNMLSEAEYIALENSYAQTLRSYGLGNMLSVDKKSNWKTFAKYIENDISAVEFKERIDTVQKRVVNADPSTKELFKKWYPSLTDQDLVSYFLDPTRSIDKLKAKTAAAEIGSAFTGQGLTTNQMSAEGYAAYGIDRAGALEGAANIAGVLPEAIKFGNIYGETGIKYDQTTGEEEFLKSSDAAKRKRNILASKERASFDASSGNAAGAYSTGYLKKSSAAGLV